MKTLLGSHTAGGWHRNIPPARHYPIIFAGRNTHVAQVITRGLLPEHEIEANANLIAAAPALLEALRGLLDAATQPEVNQWTAINAATKAIRLAQGDYT